MRLTYSLDEVGDTVGRWRTIVEQHRETLHQYCILPEESRMAPEISFATRLQILMAAYNQDYHCPAMDPAINIAAIAEGKEHVIFWGDPESIATLRAVMRKGETRVSNAALGTATLFSPNHAATHLPHASQRFEIGRTASIASMAGSVPTIALLLQAIDGFFGPCSTIYSTPRNRVGSARACPGAPIHRLHLRELRSSFWGFAPWYLMQDETVEWLDYREIYSDPKIVKRSLHEGGMLPLLSPIDVEYCRCLIQLNAPGAESRWFPSAPQAKVSSSWMVSSYLERQDVQMYNPIFIEQAPVGTEGSPLEESLARLQYVSCSCKIIRAPINTVSGAEQAILASAGFRLNSIAPHFPIPGNSLERLSLVGFWTRCDPKRAIAEPYYFSDLKDLSCLQEHEIINQARSRIGNV